MEPTLVELAQLALRHCDDVHSLSAREAGVVRDDARRLAEAVLKLASRPENLMCWVGSYDDLPLTLPSGEQLPPKNVPWPSPLPEFPKLNPNPGEGGWGKAALDWLSKQPAQQYGDSVAHAHTNAFMLTMARQNEADVSKLLEEGAKDLLKPIQYSEPGYGHEVMATVRQADHLVVDSLDELQSCLLQGHSPNRGWRYLSLPPGYQYNYYEPLPPPKNVDVEWCQDFAKRIAGVNGLSLAECVYRLLNDTKTTAEEAEALKDVLAKEDIGALSITRRAGEMVGFPTINASVKVVSLGTTQVRLRVEAPKSIPIARP